MAGVNVDVGFGIDIEPVIVLVVVLVSVTEIPLAESVMGSLAEGLPISRILYYHPHGTHVNSSLDTVLVGQKTASLVVSMSVMDIININIDVGIDVQVCTIRSVVPLAIVDTVSIDFSCGLDLSHELVGVVVASLGKVVDINIGSSIDEIVFVVVSELVSVGVLPAVGVSVVTTSNAKYIAEELAI